MTLGAEGPTGAWTGSSFACPGLTATRLRALGTLVGDAGAPPLIDGMGASKLPKREVSGTSTGVATGCGAMGAAEGGVAVSGGEDTTGVERPGDVERGDGAGDGVTKLGEIGAGIGVLKEVTEVCGECSCTVVGAATDTGFTSVGSACTTGVCTTGVSTADVNEKFVEALPATGLGTGTTPCPGRLAFPTIFLGGR